MDFSATPILGDLSPEEQNQLLALAQRRTIMAGEALFTENDSSPVLFLLLSGQCMLSQNAVPIGAARPDDWLDLIPTLGGLPHTIRAIAMSDCDLLSWPLTDLWQPPFFAVAARRYLAKTLLQTQTRLKELVAPIPYLGDSAQLSPGPFVFKNATLVIALCEANLDAVRDSLPAGLTLFRPAWRTRETLFLAMADFPVAYPDHTPAARFAYTETTCFVPVRCGRKLGLFVPYIYSSTYAPILLGREIYGFPKRLGYTIFDAGYVSLQVDGVDIFHFSYRQTESTGEPQLVGALSDWMGIPGRVTEVAFRIGDTLLDAMRVPLFRRMTVYNHQRIPSVTTTKTAPVYAVNALTQAIFSVTQWHKIARILNPELTVNESPLKEFHLTLRDAYFTKLDMRLSTGRVLRDYTQSSP